MSFARNLPESLWLETAEESRDDQGTPAEVRMPGYIVLQKREPYLGFPVVDLQWPVPVDEQRTPVLRSFTGSPVFRSDS